MVADTAGVRNLWHEVYLLVCKAITGFNPDARQLLFGIARQNRKAVLHLRNQPAVHTPSAPSLHISHSQPFHLTNYLAQKDVI